MIELNELNELLEIQKHFDARVPELDIEKTLTALFVEYAEWLNEVASFKDWKQNKVIDNVKVIEECADVMAFNFSFYNNHIKGTAIDLHTDLQEQEVHYENAKEQMTTEEISYQPCAHARIPFSTYVIHGGLLTLVIKRTIEVTGLTVEDIIVAYRNKMLKNHDRQNNGY